MSALSFSENFSGSKFIGIDEAGRGCLAGPVVAVAVILPDDIEIDDLNDSKKLLPRTREKVAVEIYKKALLWGLGLSWPREIDKINILQATFFAMSRAIGALYFKQNRLYYKNILAEGSSGNINLIMQDFLTKTLLVDGNYSIPFKVLLPILEQFLFSELKIRDESFKPNSELLNILNKKKLINSADYLNTVDRKDISLSILINFIAQIPIIKGDSKVKSIAAASVLAKTFRDKLMYSLAKKYPDYAFEEHKGYGTQKHYLALNKYGASDMHRLSFKGVIDKRTTPYGQ